MAELQKFTLPGILFALILVFGFWLSNSGKPYNGLLFNIHKLIALSFVVLAGIQFSKILHVPDGMLVALLLVSALCVVALFASGALMSAGKFDYALMLTIHRVAWVVLGIVLVWIGFILLKSP